MAREYYFNIATRQVEEGRQSDWSVLMGPYPTREAAQKAFEHARERTEEADEADRAWRQWGEGSGEGSDQGSDEAEER